MSDPIIDATKLVRRLALTHTRPIAAEEAIEKKIRELVNTEREACAQIVAEYNEPLAELIRRRGVEA